MGILVGQDGEIILVIRADGGSVQIRAGRTAEDAGLLFRSLQNAGHAAFMVEEDWPAEQDAAAHDETAEAAPWSAYKRYRARLAAAMESIEKRDRRRAAVSRKTDPDDDD